MATGTGDVAIEIIRQNDHRRKVFRIRLLRTDDQQSPTKGLKKGLSQTITLSWEMPSSFLSGTNTLTLR